MWILIVLSIAAGAGTAKNSFPITYTGVTLQEFESKESCEAAKITISAMNKKRNDGEHIQNIQNGVLDMQCVKK